MTKPLVETIIEPPRYSVRNATECDFVICVDIIRRAWPEFKERESIYHLFCKFFHNTCFIAEDNHIIKGFLLGFLSQVDTEEAYIHLVGVDPDYQRRGVASTLYLLFFNRVKCLGRRRVKLIVNPDNATSLAFHRKLGFHVDIFNETVIDHEVVAIRDYNGPGNHMVLFHKDL